MDPEAIAPSLLYNIRICLLGVSGQTFLSCGQDRERGLGVGEIGMWEVPGIGPPWAVGDKSSVVRG